MRLNVRLVDSDYWVRGMFEDNNVDEVLIVRKPVIIRLPQASGSGRVLNIKSCSTGVVTVGASDAIDRTPCLTPETIITQNESKTYCDVAPGEWVII